MVFLDSQNGIVDILASINSLSPFYNLNHYYTYRNCHNPSLHLGRECHSKTIVGPYANPHPDWQLAEDSLKYTKIEKWNKINKLNFRSFN